MAKFGAVVFAGIIAFAQPDPGYCQKPSAQTKSLTGTARRASVRITAVRADGSSNSGAGFVADTAGHVVTSAELLKDARRVVVSALVDDEERAATLAGTDTRTGIAVLSASDLPRKAVAARIGATEMAAPQDIVCATCRSDRDTVVEGVVAPLRGSGRGNPYESLVPSVSLDRQALGSALFSLDGAVVGMISGIATTPDGAIHTLAC